MKNVVWCLAGVAIGTIGTNIVFNIRSNAGTIKIDHSDPEKDQYLFEISDLDRLSSRKKIILKVDNYAILSQK